MRERDKKELNCGGRIRGASEDLEEAQLRMNLA